MAKTRQTQAGNPQANTENKAAEAKTRRRAFSRACEAAENYLKGAFLGTMLGLGIACASGCGDTNNYYYYYGSDAGPAATDSRPREDSKTDSRKPDACVADTSCVVSQEKALVQVTSPPGTKKLYALLEGDSVTSSGNTVKVKTIDETVAADGTCAVSDKKATLEIQNSGGTTQVTLKEGETLTVSGVTVGVPVISVGMNGLNCSESANLAGGIMNQGDSLALGRYKLVLDDGQQAGDAVYALLSVTDSCGKPVTKLKVQEGKQETLTLDGQSLQVNAEQVAIGATFNAKWAKVSVKDPCGTLPCAGSGAPLQCSDMDPLVSGVLNQGEMLPIKTPAGDVKFGLLLDDGQVLNGTNYAVVSLTDACGRILKKDKIQEGTTKTMAIGGEQLDVTVNSAAFGVTFGAKWANFTVKMPCAVTYWCTSVSDILNTGDSLTVDSYKIRLDDLMLPTNTSPGYALLSVLDANSNVITKLKIGEGGEVPMTLGGKSVRIRVPQVAPGYQFGAKWAEVQVQSPKDVPCGS